MSHHRRNKRDKANALHWGLSNASMWYGVHPDHHLHASMSATFETALHDCRTNVLVSDMAVPCQRFPLLVTRTSADLLVQLSACGQSRSVQYMIKKRLKQLLSTPG